MQADPLLSEGTKYAGLIDEMVKIEVEGTHAYLKV